MPSNTFGPTAEVMDRAHLHIIFHWRTRLLQPPATDDIWSRNQYILYDDMIEETDIARSYYTTHSSIDSPVADSAISCGHSTSSYIDNPESSSPDDSGVDRGVSESSTTDETDDIMKVLTPLAEPIEATLLPKQCGVVAKFVKKGQHLSALQVALNYSRRYAFAAAAADCRNVFTAEIHVYHVGEEDEAAGICLWFKKKLCMEFRKYVARQLLRGMLIRYPKRYFPRTFWVVEGTVNPIILLVNDAVGVQEQVYEYGRLIHDAVVRQWTEKQNAGLIWPRVSTCL